MTRSVRIRRQVGLALLMLVALAACSESGDPTPPSSPSPSASGPSLVVQGTWAARISSPRAAAFYFIAANDGAKMDHLIGAKSKDAASVGLFEQGGDGSTTLVPVDSIKIPGYGSVNFEPGGFEVVLMDLKGPIVVGERLSVVLEFERAGKIAVDAEVRPFVDGATLPKR